MDIGETIRGIFEVAAKQGRQEGRQEGINETQKSVATDMLKDGMPLDKIAKYSRLAEDSIRSLAKSLGVAVV
ncbi:MAG: hypothetical protein IJR98_06465 [Synergistaceae bacterium]|nr:hypothetical protein [Synergistaceae bacterium]